ncbi:MAG: hypothetical protein QOJ64_1063 [Acidobacteriota bacterium]|jgi:hypothetical protein|nr:hypothetical protein [Acidobacteriota bacterium]
MSKPNKIINTSLFVTVLSGCIGLLAVGVPPRMAVRSVKDGVRYSTAALHSHLIVNVTADTHSHYQAGKLAAANISYFSIANSRKLIQSQPLRYQSTKPLVERNQVLIVTNLPRADLSDVLANEPAVS